MTMMAYAVMDALCLPWSGIMPGVNSLHDMLA